MRLILLKCGICRTWYSPEARGYHCPNCAADPIRYRGTTRHVVYSHTLGKYIELVSGVSLAYHGIYSERADSGNKLLRVAQVLAD